MQIVELRCNDGGSLSNQPKKAETMDIFSLLVDWTLNLTFHVMAWFKERDSPWTHGSMSIGILSFRHIQLSSSISHLAVNKTLIDMSKTSQPCDTLTRNIRAISSALVSGCHMSSLLEKSLDEIIGEQPKRVGKGSSRGRSRPQGAHNGRTRHGRIGKKQGHTRAPNRSHRKPNPQNKEAERLSGGNPYLRIRNLHFDLSEEDIQVRIPLPNSNACSNFSLKLAPSNSV